MCYGFCNTALSESPPHIHYTRFISFLAFLASKIYLTQILLEDSEGQKQCFRFVLSLAVVFITSLTISALSKYLLNNEYTERGGNYFGQKYPASSPLYTCILY